ncbi:hypothetical protein RHMOL_Rhmol07G0051300 [Rhododendron molle]|uniref:Uncharacterized protein n=1 Tax=Rhododendron molle TaxID=49168 RepID=A0ACC0MX40_RHOML|nr:hypothetical protein RHMOL_Rhmol07G0051300 [Rhododendron molle]
MTRRAYFMNFVDRVLLHLKNSKMHSFYLSCDNYSDASRVSAWISAVIKRQVQKLDIKYRKEEFVVPHCVFGSDSLRKLKLVINLNVPALHSCYLDAYESGWVPDDSHDLLIRICGQDLKKFKCSSSLSENYVLDCASSVTEVNIGISKVDTEYNSQEKTTVGLRACDLLKMFLGVENLTLSCHTIEVRFIILYNLTFMAHQVRSNDIIYQFMPPLENLQALLPSYSNLVHLEFSGFKLVFDATVMAFLHSSPVLETLIFEMGCCTLQFNKDVVQEMVPQCFLSHLKVVKFVFQREYTRT